MGDCLVVAGQHKLARRPTDMTAALQLIDAVDRHLARLGQLTFSGVQEQPYNPWYIVFPARHNRYTRVPWKQ